MLQVLRPILSFEFVANSVAVNAAYILYAYVKSLILKKNKTLSLKEMSKLRKSDTLVILGAGESLNNLSAEQWEELKKYDIAGVSYSCFLPVKLDYYFYESPRAEDLLVEHDHKILPVVLKKAEQGRIRNLVWRNAYDVRSRLLTKLADFRWVPMQSSLVDKPYALKRLLHFWHRLGVSKWLALQSRGQIFGIAHMAPYIGYKKVIFCGVDLNGSQYFFENNPEYDLYGLTNPFELDRILVDQRFHATSDPSLGMPIDKAIEVLSAQAKCGYYVGNTNSKLAKFLPVWPFVAGDQR